MAAEAADLAKARQATDLAPDLAGAFRRFLVEPEKTDKQRRAKLAIAEALREFGHDDEALFWKGARHAQPEPIWGGSQDTAAPLRICCAHALVQLRARGVLPLADLLCDPEKPARIGAAQALASHGTEAAALLLRLKIRCGDEQPEVVGECFAGLIALEPEEGVALAAEYLRADQATIRR